MLGGSGFVGRHAVDSLLRAGVQVIIGTRRPGRVSGKLPDAAAACTQRKARLEELLAASDWLPLIDDVDIVLNCVGILRHLEVTGLFCADGR